MYKRFQYNIITILSTIYFFLVLLGFFPLSSESLPSLTSLFHSFFSSCNMLGVSSPCASNLSVSLPLPKVARFGVPGIKI